MIKSLIKLADHLDKKGLYKEANYVDWIVKRSETLEYMNFIDLSNALKRVGMM